MYILDTDHLSFIQRKKQAGQRILQRLAAIEGAEVAVTVITYEEQLIPNPVWLPPIHQGEWHWPLQFGLCGIGVTRFGFGIRGRLRVVAEAKTVEEQVSAYHWLQQLAFDYASITIVPFDAKPILASAQWISKSRRSRFHAG